MNDSQAARTLERLCDAFRGQFSRLLGRAALARAASLAVLLFAVLAAVDWRLHLGTPLRLAALSLFLAAVGGAIWTGLVAPLRRRWTNREVLAWLDVAVPESQGQLSDLYELVSAREQIQELENARGQELARAAIERIVPAVDKVRPGAALAAGTANRWLLAAAALGALVVLFGAVAPQHLAIGAQRLFNPFSRVRWPHRTTIELAEPANGWTVPQLESFTIQARVTGEIPARVVLAYKSPETGYWIREKLPLREISAEGAQPAASAFAASYVFPEVREPIDFFIEGGDYQTDLQRISIVERPFLKGIAAHYKYPSYAGLPDRTLTTGQIAALEGTQVRLEFESSMPLDKAVFVLALDKADGQRAGEPPADAPQESAPAVPAADASAGEDTATVAALLPAGAQRTELTRVSDTRFAIDLMLTGSGRYGVELYEKNGYREARPEVYEIRVTPDELPEVELLSPGQDLVETRQATIEVAFSARDKLGLSKVQFLYQMNDQPPVVLSDRVTGPIRQTGPESQVRFTWELRRMELPDAGNLRYFVRVADNNPTGRGQVESLPGQIKLVRPSEFHLEAIEQAKLLEEEARIAWRNQLAAWRLSGRWLTEGTGAEDDAVWAEMQDAQQKSINAARQIQFHLATLTGKYERNHMGQDFMAGRLSSVAELLTRLNDAEQTPVAQALALARPRSAADAAPDRLKTLRGQALSGAHDHQKMAVLILERMLRKLYDWRDLQTSFITTKLLYEQQDEVVARTQTLAPKTIAREIEDLGDSDQDALLTLGKQQRAIFDTETALENQITYLTYKAEQQARKSILVPLGAAFHNLRDNRVNFHLKRAAEMIENNQPSQIIDNQKAAMRALKVVEAGLVIAGQETDQEPPLTLAMLPSDEAQFDPDLIKPAEVAKTNDEPPETVSADPGTVAIELPTLPEGSDTLSAAVRLAVELEDSVLARSRYLDKNRTPAEMPRFVRLKQLRLTERQDAALGGIDQALAEAKKQENPVAEKLLASVRQEFQQSSQLIAAGQSDAVMQQIEADSIETLKALLQHLALAHAVEDAVAENRRLEGVDAFGRPYLLKGPDLDAAIEILAQLSQARLLQGDVVRKLHRFQQHRPASEPATAIEKDNRTRTADAQTEAAALVDGILSQAGSLSAEVAEKVGQTGLAGLAELKLGDYAARIGKGSDDAAVAPALDAASTTLATTIEALRDLLEERVQPPPMVAATAEPPKMTPEQFAKLSSREHLVEMLKAEESLPPEIRERMVRALEAEDFPAKYRELLTAYYASFIKAQPEPKP